MDISESLVNIPAAVFKAECLKLMDQVAKTRVPVVITKHGRPVAQLAPVPVEARSLFGYMKDTVRIEGDVTGPVDLPWTALSGADDPLPGHKPAARSRRK